MRKILEIVVCLISVAFSLRCSNSGEEPNHQILGIDNDNIVSSQKAYLKSLGFDETKLQERDSNFIYDGDIVISKSSIPVAGTLSNGNLGKVLQRKFSFVLSPDYVKDIRVRIDPSLGSWTTSINEAINAWNSSGSNIHFSIVSSGQNITLFSDMAPNCPAGFKNLQSSWLGLGNMPTNSATPGSVISLNFDHEYFALVKNIKATVIHEIGHTIGLMHTDDRSFESLNIQGTPDVEATSIMNSILSYNNTSLSTWDINAVRYLFPNWYLLPGQATDIGIGSNGTVWVVGTLKVSGGSPIYRWSGTQWQLMPGAGIKIDVDPSGNAWVVNSNYNIFKWTGSVWQPVAGQASDIGVGSDGSVYITGRASVSGGYEIFKWMGNGWSKLDGGAVRITVDNLGRPWIVNSVGAIFRRDGNLWTPLSGQATDIGAGANGSVWVLGTDFTTGGCTIHFWTNNSWTRIVGGAMQVDVDQNGQPWIANAEGNIYHKVSN